MVYDRIDLISEMLDATLNLGCFYTKGLDEELPFLKEFMLPMFINNEKEIDRFRDMLIHMMEEHVYIVDNFAFGNYIIICLDKLKESYLFIGPYLSENRHNFRHYKQPECINTRYTASDRRNSRSFKRIKGTV